jgi:hypothetical protein
MEDSKNAINDIYKIALYGDSLACPRHGIVKSHERYIALLEKYIRSQNDIKYLEIRDNAMGGATIEDLYNQFAEDNTYYELPGNILILQTGIVDCAPRPINEKIRGRISRLPHIAKTLAIKYIHKNRASLINKSGGHVKIELTKFVDLMQVFLNEGIKNYQKIFIINICPTNSAIEQHSPGLSRNIEKYNNAIGELVTNTKSEKIHLINVNGLVKNDLNNIDKYIVKEDGHHIHAITHAWIADEIIHCLN